MIGGNCPRVVVYCISDPFSVILFINILYVVNTLRPRQNGRHFSDDILNCFLNENIWILINVSLKFVPKGRINNIPAYIYIYIYSFLAMCGVYMQRIIHCVVEALTHCGLMVTPCDDLNVVNIGSGNGLLPDGKKSLPAPICFLVGPWHVHNIVIHSRKFE